MTAMSTGHHVIPNALDGTRRAHERFLKFLADLRQELQD